MHSRMNKLITNLSRSVLGMEFEVVIKYNESLDRLSRFPRLVFTSVSFPVHQILIAPATPPPV